MHISLVQQCHHVISSLCPHYYILIVLAKYRKVMSSVCVISSLNQLGCIYWLAKYLMLSGLDKFFGLYHSLPLLLGWLALIPWHYWVPLWYWSYDLNSFVLISCRVLFENMLCIMSYLFGSQACCLGRFCYISDKIVATGRLDQSVQVLSPLSISTWINATLISY
jgi:hypothetical protein